MDFGISGLASGFDWRSLIDQILELERAPQQRLRAEQSVLQQRNTAYSNIKTQLGALATRVDSLKSTDLFDARSVQVGDSSVLNATVAAGTPLGSYTINVTQLATSAKFLGAINAGKTISNNNNVSGVTLQNAGFATDVTAGTFTVNGKQVTVAVTDTIQDVFNKIATATGNVVSGSYRNNTDKITLTASGNTTITLGSATDTSNFLEVVKLYNNGTNTVVSSTELGAIRINKTLASANFTTTVTDGGSGNGSFKINGVSISYNATTDTVANVLDRINNSSAGVLANYDPTTDQFVLTNKTTGDVGISVEDVTGNFAVATKLSTGTLTRGQNMLYTLNGGSQLVSQSNSVTPSTANGLTLTALKTGSTSVTVSTDTAKVKTAINDFITEYNKLQSLIDTQTASSTDDKGKVTRGILAGDPEASEMASKLRSLIYSQVTGLSGVFDHLDDLGITSNGNDNVISLSDSAKLDSALSTNLSSVKDLFTNSTKGLAITLDNYLDDTIGDDGTLKAKQDLLTRQSSEIDKQVADLERIVQSNKDRLTASFLAMESAQAVINQQLSFLSQRFGGTK